MTVATKTSVLDKVWQLPSRVLRQLNEHGIRNTIFRAFYRWRCNRRERQLGIQTTASIDGQQLGNGAEENLGYQPIPFESFDRAMEHVDLSSGNEVFIDYGCGMGRAVVMAGLLPFKRVLGVELSDELADVARQNLSVAKHQMQSTESEIFTADATRFDLPDDVSVVFMFNPFCGEILQNVLDRIRQSLCDKPRRCCFIYAQPRGNENLLDRCRWLTRRIEVEVPSEPWQQLAIYDFDKSANRTETRELAEVEAQ